MKTMLGVSVDKIDKLKYIRQLRSIVLWMKSGARGTIVAATGYGKTFLAFIAIKKMNKLRPHNNTIIIVPTIPLKNQWEKQIEILKLKNVKVYVVNTIALKDEKYKCNLLIVDEVHMMGAEQFIRIFHLVKCTWLMGLTATIERLDGKHFLLQKFAPVVDTITQVEAIKKGWISDYIEINLAIPLNKKEIEEMDTLDKQIHYYISKFSDFDNMYHCMNFENAKTYAQLHYPFEDSEYKAKEIVRWAVQGQRLIKQRQSFLYCTERKVDAAVELIKEFDLKTITFSQSTQFADKVADKIGDKATVYHSNIPSSIEIITKTKFYKNYNKAIEFVNKNPNSKIGVKTNEGYPVTWLSEKKLGKKSLKLKAIENFKDKRSKINVICTAKALDQGFDVADTELGIDGSRTSNPTQHIQRTGRIARNYEYKDGTKKRGIYINLYIPGSRDESWLRKCQSKNPDRIIWIYDINECKTFIKELLGI